MMEIPFFGAEKARGNIAAPVGKSPAREPVQR
jgi:hypothetical protein